MTYLFLKDTEIHRFRPRLFYLYYLKLFTLLGKINYYANSLNRRINKSKGNTPLGFGGFLLVSIAQKIPIMIPDETSFSVKMKTPKSKQHATLTNPSPHLFHSYSYVFHLKLQKTFFCFNL